MLGKLNTEDILNVWQIRKASKLSNVFEWMTKQKKYTILKRRTLLRDTRKLRRTLKAEVLKVAGA